VPSPKPALDGTITFYDALRRPVAMRDPLGQTVTQQWCTCGSLDKLIDAAGNAITWERDLQGRVTREVRADGSATTFAFENTTSRLKQKTDAKNQTVTYQYALDDTQTQVTYTSAQVPTPTVTFTYDPAYMRLATMIDGTGTTTYAYHPPGVLGAGQVASIDGPLPNDTITYGYDELGRVTTRQINGVANALSVAYDALGRITSETNALGAFSYTYDGVTGRVSTLTYPNGQTVSYAYFGNAGDHRLQQLHNRLAGGATLSKFDYSHDAVGNVKTWSQQIGTNPAKVLTFGYDAAGQLTSASASPAGVAPNRFAYAYDAAGNRTAEQLDDVVTGATYDSLNRLVSQQPGGALLFRGTVSEPATVAIGGRPAQVGTDNAFVGSAPVGSGTSTVAIVATDPSGNVRTNTYQVSQTGASKSFTYDLNGNLSSDGTRTYEWDGENRLTAVVSGTRRSEFTYDGNDRRVRIVEKDGATVLTDRRFVLCEGTLCEERDASGSTLLRRFHRHGVVDGATAYFTTQDHLGSVREITDSSGNLSARYDYDPYGRATKVAGTYDATFGFTGHYKHEPSGLFLPVYRAYAPEMGRWTSGDPAGLADGPNVYAYVGNNPINKLDPLGLAGICWQNMKLTAIVNCNIEYVSHSGFCGLGSIQKKIQKACSDMMAMITKKGNADLYDAVCPSGETCGDLKPVTEYRPINEQVTLKEKTCTVVVKITGEFRGSGMMGTCKKPPGGGC
jgi:RHS repeat-associated protein